MRQQIKQNLNALIRLVPSYREFFMSYTKKSSALDSDIAVITHKQNTHSSRKKALVKREQTSQCGIQRAMRGL